MSVLIEPIKKIKEKIKYFNRQQKPISGAKNIGEKIKSLNFFKKLQNLLSEKKLQNVLSGSLSALKKSLKKINLKSPKGIVAVTLLTVILVTVLSLTYTFTYAVSVSVNGNQLGYVPDLQQAETLVADALAEQAENLEVTAKTDDEITYDEVWVKKKEYQANLLDENALIAAITPYVEAYGLAIDGEILAVLQTEQEIDEVLDGYKDYITNPSETNKIISAEFVENVTKEKVKASIGEIMAADAVLDMLIQGEVSTVEYTVQKDDSLWLIARNHDMYTQEILDANPDITEESILQPGQVLKLSTIEPYLTVKYSGQKVVKEVIPFDVQTKTDYSLAYGKRVVKQYGQDGEKEVTFTYTAQNDEVVEKTVVKEEVISEPVTQVIAQGPVPQTVTTVSTSRGSGSISGMSWPLSGRITSYYGYRSSGFHTGIDISGSVGQPYYAAADGKVIAAGWYGNYGKMILIDHGNGVATRYAHSSQLLVSVGSTVKKGQTIGYVGLTGNTTGPHLHFEVIINGSTVNPLDYL